MVHGVRAWYIYVGCVVGVSLLVAVDAVGWFPYWRTVVRLIFWETGCERAAALWASWRSTASLTSTSMLRLSVSESELRT